MDSITAVIIYISINLFVSTTAAGIEKEEAAEMNMLMDIGVLIILIIILITLVISDNF